MYDALPAPRYRLSPEAAWLPKSKVSFDRVSCAPLTISAPPSEAAVLPVSTLRPIETLVATPAA